MVSSRSPAGSARSKGFCEAITWTQLGLHRKGWRAPECRRVLRPVTGAVRPRVADGFLKAANRSLVADDTDPAVLLDKLSLPLTAPEPKWIRTTEET